MVELIEVDLVDLDRVALALIVVVLCLMRVVGFEVIVVLFGLGTGTI